MERKEAGRKGPHAKRNSRQCTMEVRATASELERWKETAERLGYRSLSSFVRAKLSNHSNMDALNALARQAVLEQFALAEMRLAHHIGSLRHFTDSASRAGLSETDPRSGMATLALKEIRQAARSLAATLAVLREH